jgi:hypothetical protein
MILFNEVSWAAPGVKLDRLRRNEKATQLGLLIDNEVVHIIGVDVWFADVLINALSFEDMAEQPFSDIGDFLLKIIKNDNTKELFVCNEILYSILLSSPQIIPITNSNKYVQFINVGWKYINNEFILEGVYE